jgi:Flp pilus assembly protein TadG
MNRPRYERGSATVELVLLTPLLVGLLLMVVAFGRLQNARGDVEAAARAAARAASIERDAASARAAGESAAFMEFDGGRFRCATLRFDIDVAAFNADAEVTATVSCRVALSDVSGLGLPGSHTVTATFTEPLDRYRGTR